jgi:hypothetical protein
MEWIYLPINQTMKFRKTFMVTVIGLALMSSGCAYLRPPTNMWEEEREAQQRKEQSQLNKDPLANACEAGYILGSLGYALSAIR